MNNLQATLESLTTDMESLSEVIKQIISIKGDKETLAIIKSYRHKIWNEISQMSGYITSLEQAKSGVPKHAGTLESIKNTLESDILPGLEILVPSKDKAVHDATVVNSLNQKLLEVISPIKGLLNEIIQSVKPSSEQSGKANTDPPLSVKAAMHIAWGLTLHVSHETSQQDLSKVFEGRFEKIWETHKPDKHALEYLEHVSAMMSASLRSMAFEKDVYTRHINYFEKAKEAKIKSVEEWANLTSFNADGLLSRLIAIVSGGTLGSAIAKLIGHETTTAKEALEKATQQIKELSGSLKSTETTNIPSKLSELVKDITTTSEQLGSVYEPFLIAIGILVGFLVFWIWAKIRRDRVTKKALDETHKKTQDYWHKSMRGYFSNSLVKLYKNLRTLEGLYYAESKEYKEIENDDKKGEDWADAILPRKSLYEKIPAV